MIVIEVMPSPDRHDNGPGLDARNFLSRLAFSICGRYFAGVSPAYPPKPDEEREKEAHRRQAAKLARVDHQEARAIP